MSSPKAEQKDLEETGKTSEQGTEPQADTKDPQEDMIGLQEVMTDLRVDLIVTENLKKTKNSSWGKRGKTMTTMLIIE